MFDGLHEECGVFAIYGHQEASFLTYLGLHALQHRGQESAGIAVGDGDNINVYRDMGLVSDVFTEDHLRTLSGHLAIGHVRYSTTGGSMLENVQPFSVKTRQGAIALAHNGNLTNTDALTKEFLGRGRLFHSASDSELLLHLVASQKTLVLEDALQVLLERAEGAYSIVAMTPRGIAAVRDPKGYRPLVIGKLGDAWVFSSETTSLDLIGATYEREVEPGEIVVVDYNGMRSHKFTPKSGLQRCELQRCVFEFVYFARPDSIVFGKPVYEVRKRMGRQLAIENPVPKADIVIPVPDSGVAAAIGYAEQMGVPFDMGLIRSHYVGRTFIEPEQRIRNFGVKLKLNPLPHYLRDKVVVVVDDSIVRGTTSKKIIQMLRARGPKEIHLRISSPPVKSSCHFGIDTPTSEELIASRLDNQGIAEFIGADSVGYLSVPGLLSAVDENKPGYCTTCFKGNTDPVS